MHTYIHTYILYVRGLCRLHQRFGLYGHHTSESSFCSNIRTYIHTYIHTYLHTYILYVRGLCRLHQRLRPYRHHTSQTSFCANSVRSMQELKAFRHVATAIPTENGTQMETCIAQTMLFSDRAVGHCREIEH